MPHFSPDSIGNNSHSTFSQPNTVESVLAGRAEKEANEAERAARIAEVERCKATPSMAAELRLAWERKTYRTWLESWAVVRKSDTHLDRRSELWRAAQSQLKPIDQVVYGVLCDYARKHPNPGLAKKGRVIAQVPQHYMARIIGVCEKTIRRSLNRLDDIRVYKAAESDAESEIRLCRKSRPRDVEYEQKKKAGKLQPGDHPRTVNIYDLPVDVLCVVSKGTNRRRDEAAKFIQRHEPKLIPAPVFSVARPSKRTSVTDRSNFVESKEVRPRSGTDTDDLWSSKVVSRPGRELISGDESPTDCRAAFWRAMKPTDGGGNGPPPTSR